MIHSKPLNLQAEGWWFACSWVPALPCLYTKVSHDPDGHAVQAAVFTLWCLSENTVGGSTQVRLRECFIP